MNKTESVVVGLFIGAACPLMTFILCWWPSAFLHMHFSIIPLNLVIASALTGLCLGFLLDILFLKRWIRMFYMANIWLMAFLYLGLCIVAMAMFMGLPIGTIVIGTAAGIYCGRRAKLHHENRTTASRWLRRTALVAASTTTMIALPIGILAINQQDIQAALENLSGMSRSSLENMGGHVLVAILCALLFCMQYWLSKKAGIFAYGRGDETIDHEGGFFIPGIRRANPLSKKAESAIRKGVLK